MKINAGEALRNVLAGEKRRSMSSVPLSDTREPTGESTGTRLLRAADFHRDDARVFTLIQMDGFPCAAVSHSNAPARSHG